MIVVVVVAAHSSLSQCECDRQDFLVCLPSFFFFFIRSRHNGPFCRSVLPTLFYSLSPFHSENDSLAFFFFSYIDIHIDIGIVMNQWLNEWNGKWRSRNNQCASHKAFQRQRKLQQSCFSFHSLLWNVDKSPFLFRSILLPFGKCILWHTEHRKHKFRILIVRVTQTYIRCRFSFSSVSLFLFYVLLFEQIWLSEIHFFFFVALFGAKYVSWCFAATYLNSVFRFNGQWMRFLFLRA